jgi:hypothetical protein
LLGQLQRYQRLEGSNTSKEKHQNILNGFELKLSQSPNFENEESTIIELRSGRLLGSILHVPTRSCPRCLLV